MLKLFQHRTGISQTLVSFRIEQRLSYLCDREINLG